MICRHISGFSRMGSQQELKTVLESVWQGVTGRDDLETIGKQFVPVTELYRRRRD